MKTAARFLSQYFGACGMHTVQWHKNSRRSDPPPPARKNRVKKETAGLPVWICFYWSVICVILSGGRREGGLVVRCGGGGGPRFFSSLAFLYMYLSIHSTPSHTADRVRSACSWGSLTPGKIFFTHEKSS